MSNPYKSEHEYIIITEPERTTEDYLVDAATLFREDKEFKFLNKNVDLFDILVDAEIFKSKSDARRNWNRSSKDIEYGWTKIDDIGKFRHIVSIWKPTWEREGFERFIELKAVSYRILTDKKLDDLGQDKSGLLTLEQARTNSTRFTDSLIFVGNNSYRLTNEIQKS